MQLGAFPSVWPGSELIATHTYTIMQNLVPKAPAELTSGESRAGVK